MVLENLIWNFATYKTRLKEHMKCLKQVAPKEKKGKAKIDWSSGSHDEKDDA